MIPNMLENRVRALQYAADIARDHSRGGLAESIDELTAEIRDHLDKRIEWENQLHYLRGYEAGMQAGQESDDEAEPDEPGGEYRSETQGLVR